MSHLNQGFANLSPEKRALLEARLLKKAVPKEATILRRDPSKPCRLSFAQEQLWFLDQVLPDTPTYNIAEILRLRGRLELAALERSLSELLARHEGLRTTFAADSNEPFQVIQPPQPVRLSVIDLKDSPEPERLQEACRLANEEARRPFALSTGPLIRFQVIRLYEEDWVLGIHMHHIIADGWSIGVMTSELGELYRAFVQGRAAMLPGLPVQYADFAQWQRGWLEGGACMQHLAYWKEKLADAPELLTLPGDRPRPAALSFRGGYQSFVVPRTLADELQSLGRREGATLFMTLLAVFDVLLLAYTDQEDLVVGSPVAGRNLVEIENIIGFFVNMVVLRTDVSGNPSFRELLRRTRETATNAFAHQEAPFEKLVEALRPARTSSYNPLFQVALILQNAPGEELELPGLALSRLPVGTGTSKFDLTLFASDKADGLHLGIEYSSDLFDDATIRRMLGHLHQLIQGAVANPGCQIRRLPLLTEIERHQLLVGWNDEARRDYRSEDCIHELFEAQVQRTPEVVALIDGQRRFTYRELNRRANQVAVHLRMSGVGPEVLVGVCLERSAEMVIALLGTLKAGGAYVPVDPDYPKDRVAFMLEDTQAAVVLTQRSLVLGLPPSQAQVICIDELKRDQEGEDTPNAGRNANPTNLAYVIYTSGSTGKPKGAMNEHRGVVNRLLWMQEQYQLTAADVVMQKTPFSFDVSVWEFFWPLLAGARLVIAKPGGHKDPRYLIELINECRVTTIHFVPPMLRTFLAEPGVESCRSLRQVVCSGEALPFDLQESFFEKLPAALHNLYGPTEAAVDVTHWTCQRDSPLRIVPIGRPVANTQTYILDARLQPVPIGVPGELHLGGVQVGRGYLHRPELTTEKFIPDPFRREPGARLYKTGDLCRYLADGNIEYLDRLDHQVKIRGFRIELGEIESVLCEHAAVREAAVLARESTPGNKQLVAYLIVNGQTPTVKELREHLKQQVPDYMVPAAFVFLEKLPLTHNGKIDRKALPEPEKQSPELAAAYVAPRNETESMLAEIWLQVLQVERVGIHDNFFELGGHSLLVLRVVSRIRQQFGFDLPLPLVFETPNIAELAVKLSDLQIANSDRDELARLVEEIESDPGKVS
jgi:amino acid adenylation domain-containing protein